MKGFCFIGVRMKGFKHVMIHKKWRHTNIQRISFYDKVLKSESIEYRGKVYCGVYLSTPIHVRALLGKKRGWIDITEDYFKYLEEKKAEESKPEKPPAKKRGRPKKSKE